MPGLMDNVMSMFQRSAAPAAKPAAKDDKDPTKDPNNKDNKNNGDKSQDGQLDIFKGLFDNATTDGENKTPSFNLDPQKVKALVDSQSFSPEITAELTQKLQSGDPTAMKEILESVGRTAYSRIFEHLPQLTEAYVNARMEHSRKGLGGEVKQHLTMQSLKAKAASNPVLSAQLEDIGKRLLAKHPDADPDWIAEKTVEYFVYTAKQLSPDAFKAEEGDDKGMKGDHQAGGNTPDNYWQDWITATPPQKSNI